MRRVRAEWTGGPSTDNGAYGLYPVQVDNVLIEDSVVKGASDAGIYVGQSTNIIVRNNRAEGNVAGIEIENSTGADVYGNTTTGRSEEHTSELQSLMRISYAVFCLNKKKISPSNTTRRTQ